MRGLYPSTGSLKSWVALQLPLALFALALCSCNPLVGAQTTDSNFNPGISIGSSPSTAPAGLSVLAGNATVNLSWSPVSGALTYTVKRSITSGSGYVAIASAISGTSYSYTSVTNGTIYYYVLVAV